MESRDHYLTLDDYIYITTGKSKEEQFSSPNKENKVADSKEYWWKLYGNKSAIDSKGIYIILIC